MRRSPTTDRPLKGRWLTVTTAALTVAARSAMSIARAKAFAQGLQDLGWLEGRNVPASLLARADKVIE